MALIHLLDGDGGFTVGDTNTGTTLYAYPTSPRASQARRNPVGVATTMQTDANTWGVRENDVGYHRHNWQRLLAIRGRT